MAIPFEATIPGTPRAVGTLRRELAAMAKDCGMDTEGVQNGVLAIVISDSGPGLVERHDSPGLGAGLSVIASVAERMKIISRSSGTEIHMAFPCPDVD